ncbi:MAG TPA: SRPBCC domain-containing protein [Bacteroidia bacterium]|nr:SRPBCC domain-containing protein [Bacteroidia bacterium]
MEKLIVTNTVAISATPQRVWDVLTKPEETKKYMFGCETVSDWKEGSALLWKGEYEGKEMVFVSGFILEIVPGKLLRYSVIDPNAAYPQTPENHLRVTYEITPGNGSVTLTVTQDGFEGAAEGEKRYRDTYNNGDGWNPVLQAIRKVAEER